MSELLQAVLSDSSARSSAELTHVASKSAGDLLPWGAV